MLSSASKRIWISNVSGWLMTVAVLMSLSLGRLLAGETATAVTTITAGFVSGITVTSGGSGYTSEPAVIFSGGGGSGASGKAILAGDKVALILVLTAGTGYTGSPTVTVEAPPKALNVRLRLVPELTVEGPAGSLAKVEAAWNLTGPWTTWTNVAVGAEGTVLVDLSPGSATRFYRSMAVGPTGFVWINPGTFVMGSPLSEADRGSDEVQHTVTLTQGFWVSDHEMKQAEYEAVMGGNPSSFKGDLNRPVDSVSWNDAVLYCQKLTERERGAGLITARQAYRLPTEAEWEYSARAGTTGARYGELAAISWWAGNAGNATHPVKQKAANAWGLYDMIGSVFEWCGDLYGAYPTGSVTDPTSPSSGSARVDRGGGWFYGARYARSAYRSGHDSGFRNDNLGFRPVLSAVR